MAETPIYRLRLSPDVRARLQAQADAAGMSLAAWLRDVALQAAATGADPAATRAEIAGLRREANAIGVNLNQLARHANAGGEPDADALERAVDAIKRVHARADRVLNLGRAR